MNRVEKSALSKQRQPSPGFRSLPQEGYLRLLTVTNQLSHQVDQLLRSFGISQPQFNVLRILAGAGGEGLGRNEIAARMVTTTPDMTRLLNRMMEKGWVIRERGTEDRREVPTTLTAAGKQLLKDVNAPLEHLHERQMRGLSATGKRQLLTLLKKITATEPKDR